jgi:formamidopyrimidine-DNA glycosylase
MPELPEVETVIRGLGKLLPGQTIKKVEVLTPRSFLWTAPIKKPTITEGLKVLSLARRGKGIIINLSKGFSLLIHLKMTGQLIYVPRGGKRLNYGHPDDNFLTTMPSRHTRIIFELTKGKLYFNDQRLFGWVKLMPTDEVANDSFIKKLGPEPLTPDFNPEMFWEILKRRKNSNIKSIILDQAVTSGVGNIYADESLFAARIRPTRLAKNITKPEATKLVKAIKDALALGIKHSGTSISHYKMGNGAPGSMQNYLKMYGHDNEPCPGRCGGTIKKIRIAGRGTHYCPICQK